MILSETKCSQRLSDFSKRNPKFAAYKTNHELSTDHFK